MKSDSKLEAKYKKNISNYEEKLSKVSSTFLIVVYLRLAVFVGTILLTYILWNEKSLITIIAISGIVLFIYLIRKTVDLSYQKKYTENILKINKSEILALNGDYSDFENGNQYIETFHDYSYDIDMFGEKSFFQYINRCKTIGGRDKLANGLQNPQFKQLESRQEAIEELSNDLDWNQSYMTIASLIDSDFKDKDVVAWIQSYKSILPQGIKYFLYIFPVVSIGIIISVYFGIIPIQILYLLMLLGLIISGKYVKQINAVHNDSSKITDTLRQYTKLLSLIKNKTFSSNHLVALQKSIKKDGKEASIIIRNLYKIFNSLDQRSNILVALPINALFLSDMQAIYRLEIWMKKFQSMAEEWFECIYQYDELISCSNYLYNHPNMVFPKLIKTDITKNELLLEVKDLGHPLISTTKRVNNNYALSKDHFTIITGANMAGKSTFLRALGLNIILANNGMPVTATYMKYKPTKLISSMRTTDSLNKEESYFFSELKRLKYIVDKCKDSTYFIILDEILKGTNSKDKAEGSKKFLERMRTSGSSGVIATHDLSLCELENIYSEFNNKYFDAEIIDDELFFDYKLKEGQCTNMNASFLLNKMGIV